MSEQNKHIDDFFRERVGGHTETPPPAAWKGLEQKLDSAVTPGGVVSYYKWLRYGIVISAVSVLVYFSARKFMDTNEPPATTERQIAAHTDQASPEVVNGNAVAANYNQQNAANENAGENSEAANTSHEVNNTNSNNNTTGIQANDNKQQNTVNTNQNTTAKTQQDHIAVANNNNPTVNGAHKNNQPLTSRMNKGNIQAFTGNASNMDYAQNSSKTVKTGQEKPAKANNTANAPVENAFNAKPVSGGSAIKPNNTGAANNVPQANSTVNSAIAGGIKSNEGLQQINPAASSAGAEAKTKTKTASEPVNKETPQVEEPKKKVRLPMIVESGVKLGYELGFQRFAANKYVVAPYISYSKGKWGVMVQPAFKLARMNRTANLGDASVYYNVTNAPRLFDIQDTIFATTNTRTRTSWYTESHDSIVVTHRVATKSFTEIELPVLLTYKPVKNLSIYGGPLVDYTTIVQIQEDKHVGSYNRVSTIEQSWDASQTGPAIPDASTAFNYGGIAYAKYTTAGYDNVSSSKLAFSYMLGFTYAYKEKYTLDVSMLQNVSNMGYIPNKDIRGVYTQPYVRISAGYKFFQDKKKKR